MVTKKIYTEPAKAGQDESSLERGLQDLALADPNSPSLSLHPLPSEDALIVKIQPPRKPTSSPTGLRRTPCDIVVVIDTSGSMNVAAPAPAANSEANEDTGLSVLDLTKLAARTILATLGADDRLGIVTFSREATVVQALLPMDDEAKTKAGILIDMLQACGPTNLWHGILEGVQLFRTPDAAEDGDRAEITRNPAVIVLTDGAPNHMCPAQGYVAKLSTMLPTLPPIHTFGFGNSIRSDLLKSIAEITYGNYAFLPDDSMIGTVFVHAVASMQAAYAHSARLLIKHPEAVIIEETTRATVCSTEDDATSKEHAITRIALGSILFGQSRDLYLRLRPRDATVKLRDIEKFYATAELVYSPMAGASLSTTATADLSYPGDPLPETDIDYHPSRSQLCNFISLLFTFDTLGEPMNECHARRQVGRSSLRATSPAPSWEESYDNSSRSLACENVSYEKPESPKSQLARLVEDFLNITGQAWPTHWPPRAWFLAEYALTRIRHSRISRFASSLNLPQKDIEQIWLEDKLDDALWQIWVTNMSIEALEWYYDVSKGSLGATFWRAYELMLHARDEIPMNREPTTNIEKSARVAVAAWVQLRRGDIAANALQKDMIPQEYFLQFSELLQSEGGRKFADGLGEMYVEEYLIFVDAYPRLNREIWGVEEEKG